MSVDVALGIVIFAISVAAVVGGGVAFIWAGPQGQRGGPGTAEAAGNPA